MEPWLDEVLAILLDMLEKGEEIPDEIYAAIVDAIEGEALSPEGPSISGPKEPIGELPSAPYPSSNINSFKYDPETQKLLVKFMGKDTANSGPTYKYEGVPDYIVDIFARGAVGPKSTGRNKYHAWFKGITPSHGAAMAALIKKGPYPYQKVA